MSEIRDNDTKCQLNGISGKVLDLLTDTEPERLRGNHISGSTLVEYQAVVSFTPSQRRSL